MRRLLALLGTLSTLAVTTDHAAATLSCSTVTRRGATTPDSLVHSSRFQEPVSINSSGDVLLISKPETSRDRLYLYPDAGPAETVAAVFQPAPNGGIFTSNDPFRDLSLSNAGHVAFFATTTLGPAVFVREGGGALEAAATAAQVSPTGGLYDGFPEVSSIDDSAQVAFRAIVDGGPTGIFLYDAVLESLSAPLLLGDTTIGGRQICSVRDIELASTGAILFTATTQLDCNAVETAVDGIFLDTPSGIETIVLVGDASPVLGTAHGAIVGPADVNGSENVLFRTKLVGPLTSTTVFFWDRATATTYAVASINQASPIGGVYRKFRDVHLSDADRVFVSAKLRGPASEPFGLFEFPGGTTTPVGDPVLVRSDPPPADLFTPPSAYLRFGEVFDLSSDGRVAWKVRVKDSAPPRAKVGVIRCASPSGAFLDGDAFF